jgi:hypothetical protein
MALARKLAAWFWRVMVKGDDFVEQGIAHYEAEFFKPNSEHSSVSQRNSDNNPSPSSRPTDQLLTTRVPSLKSTTYRIGSWKG